MSSPHSYRHTTGRHSWWRKHLPINPIAVLLLVIVLVALAAVVVVLLATMAAGPHPNAASASLASSVSSFSSSDPTAGAAAALQPPYPTDVATSQVGGYRRLLRRAAGSRGETRGQLVRERGALAASVLLCASLLWILAESALAVYGRRRRRPTGAAMSPGGRPDIAEDVRDDREWRLEEGRRRGGAEVGEYRDSLA